MNSIDYIKQTLSRFGVKYSVSNFKKGQTVIVFEYDKTEYWIKQNDDYYCAYKNSTLYKSNVSLISLMTDLMPTNKMFQVEKALRQIDKLVVISEDTNDKDLHDVCGQVYAQLQEYQKRIINN